MLDVMGGTLNAPMDIIGTTNRPNRLYALRAGLAGK